MSIAWLSHSVYSYNKYMDIRVWLFIVSTDHVYLYKFILVVLLVF